jgi:hypothetical protein
MATMTRGSVTFDSVNDDELAKAVEFKAKHEKELEFDPSQLRKAHNINPLYDNMVISWSTNQAYAAAHELITTLIGTSQV